MTRLFASGVNDETLVSLIHASHYHVVKWKFFIFSLNIDHAIVSTRLNLSESPPIAVGLALGHLSKLVIVLVTYLNSHSSSSSSFFAIIYGFTSWNDFFFMVGSLNGRSCLPGSQTVPYLLKAWWESLRSFLPIHNTGLIFSFAFSGQPLYSDISNSMVGTSRSGHSVSGSTLPCCLIYLLKIFNYFHPFRGEAY